MKKSNRQLNINNKVITATATVTAFFMTCPVYANVTKLNNAKKAMDEVQKELTVLIPLAAAVILVLLATGYAGRFIERSTFIRWSIGVIIAGSATALSNLLFKGA
ncbi:VirB2 family type IV secretion system major pilin TrwL [Bartonella sp. B35(2025)]